MKQLFSLLFAMTLCMGTLVAQHETLFNKRTSIGGFASVITETGSINGDIRTSVGGGAGLVVDNFFVGAYGLGSADYQGFWNGDRPFVDLAHGGFWLGYNYNTYKLIHPYTSLKIGWGAIGVDPSRDLFDNRDVDGIFVVTPEIGAELNIAKWLRVAATLNYRIVNDVEVDNYANKDFGGLNGGITFRFGWFGKPTYKEPMDSGI